MFFVYKEGQGELIEAEKTIKVTLSLADRAQYNLLWNSFLESQRAKGINNPNVLMAQKAIEIIKMRELISNIKAKSFLYRVDKIKPPISPEWHYIIFVHFISTKNFLQVELQARGYSAIIYDEYNNVQQWEKEGGFLILSAQKGGMMLDLSQANSCALIDKEWNYKDIQQAKARIKGPRQKAKRVVYTFYEAIDTIDADMNTMNIDKNAQIEQKLGL